MAQDDVGTTPEPEPTPEPAPEAPQAPPTTPPATPAPEAAAAPAPAGDDPSQDNPVMALLSYLLGLIFILIILLTDMKKSRYNRFHAWQALFLGLSFLAIFVALAILGTILGFIPVVNIIAGIAMFVLYPLLCIAILILNIVVGIKAYNKQEIILPLVGEWATKQADK